MLRQSIQTEYGSTWTNAVHRLQMVRGGGAPGQRFLRLEVDVWQSLTAKRNGAKPITREFTLTQADPELADIAEALYTYLKRQPEYSGAAEIPEE